MRQFYDLVCLPDLAQASHDLHYPLRLLILALDVYLGPRLLTLQLQVHLGLLPVPASWRGVARRCHGPSLICMTRSGPPTNLPRDLG